MLDGDVAAVAAHVARTRIADDAVLPPLVPALPPRLCARMPITAPVLVVWIWPELLTVTVPPCAAGPASAAAREEIAGAPRAAAPGDALREDAVAAHARSADGHARAQADIAAAARAAAGAAADIARAVAAIAAIAARADRRDAGQVVRDGGDVAVVGGGHRCGDVRPVGAAAAGRGIGTDREAAAEDADPDASAEAAIAAVRAALDVRILMDVARRGREGEARTRRSVDPLPCGGRAEPTPALTSVTIGVVIVPPPLLSSVTPVTCRRSAGPRSPYR